MATEEEQLRELQQISELRNRQRKSDTEPKFIDRATDFVTSEEGMRKLGRFGIEAAAGTVAGLAVGGPVGAAIGAGTKAARVAVPAARMAAAGLAEGAASLVSESFDPSERPFAKAAETAVLGAVGEGVSSVIGRVARGGFGAEPGGLEAFDESIRRVGVADASLFSSSGTVRAMGQLAKRSMGGGGRMKHAQEAAEEVQIEIAERVVRSFGSEAGSEATGKLAREAIEGSSEAFREVGGVMYDRVTDLAGGARVDISDALSALTKRDLRAQGASARAIKELERFFGGKIPSDVSFSEAQQIRSFFLAQRDPDELVKGASAALGSRVSGLVDKAMERAARGLDGEALGAWRAANAFWKEGSEKFSDNLIRSLIKANDDQVIDKIARSPALVRRVKNIVDADTFEEVRGQMLRNLIDDKSDDAVPVGRRILRALSTRKTREAFGAAFSQDEIQQIRRVFRRVQDSQDGRVSKVSRFFLGSVMPIESGGVLMAMTGFGMQPLVVSAAPAVAAAILTSKKLGRWILAGTDSSVTREAFIRAATQFATLAQAEGAIVENIPDFASTTRRPAVSGPASATLGGPR